MFITHPDIEKYLLSLSKEEDPVLNQMEEYGHSINFPIIDRLVGRLLFVLTKIKKPKLVVELGSGFGYSAYWFAKALENDGKVVVVDYKEENIQKAKDFFEKGGVLNKAVFEVGDAVKVAKKYQDIDILFMDLEKSRYLEAFKEVEPNLSKDAVIIADNTLWSGKVLQENLDSQTRGLKEFTEYMFKNPDYYTSLVPLRDGVLIAVRL